MIHFARTRSRLSREVEAWRGRYDEQAATASAALARTELIDSQRRDLEGKVADEQTLRFSTESALSELRGRLDEQQRAADARFTENEAKITTTKTRLESVNTQKAEVEDRLREADQDRALLAQKLSAMNAERAKEREHLDEQLATLKDGREMMTKEFKVLADELMRTQGEDLRKSASEQLVGIVAPLKENLGKFEGEMKSAREEAIKERSSLKEQLLALTTQSQAVSKEAETLAKALRGDTQKQGAWGEIILTRVLETAGMEEGREFITQQSHTSEDGRRLRPDVMVTLAEDKQLVIDSKVSLKAYDVAVNSDDPTEREAALRRHVESLQAHIKDLAGKGYDKLATGSGDYVVMFVPIEGALSDALRARADLTEFALERHVMIATPTTLMMALRTIKNVWDVERRTQNAEEIASRAGALFDKVVGFTTDLEKVGKHLDDAKRIHDEAVSKLSTGRGNVLRQVQMLKDLGAKTNKALPSTLAIEAEYEADEGPVSRGHQLPN